MNQEQLALLLDRYLKGLCTPDERTIIDQWYNKQENSFDDLNMPSDQKRESMKRRALQILLEDIKKDKQEPVLVKTLIGRQWFIKCIAAAALVLLFVGVISTYHFTKNNTQELVAQKEIVNNTKNIIKQVLPDKSIVWLSPQSRLKFPEKFAGKTRKVDMEGECFFEISKNPKQPFVIYSEHLVTKVLGTSFKVSDKNESSTALVSVLTGKVSVKSATTTAMTKNAKADEGEIMLYPQQRVIFKKREKKLYQGKIADSDHIQMYKHLNLLFENAKLATIVAVLNKNFDADIHIADQKLKDKIMDADLTGLNLPEILEVLKTSLRLDYELNDQQIILKTDKLTN